MGPPAAVGGFLVGQIVAMTRRYLSRTEVAELIGVKPDTLGRYVLPAPDALIGTTRGWLPSTIDTWHEARPGRGRRWT